MKRINYNSLTGSIINVVDAPNISIDHIDLADNDTTLQNAETYHVDITTKQIIIDSILAHIPTYEELQQQLLQAQGVI